MPAGYEGARSRCGAALNEKRKTTRRGNMRMTRGLYLGAAVLAMALALVGPSTQINAQTPPALSVGAAEIGGIVSGPTGPEAGVWVIAETTDLPTKYAKIVVTDDQGRYMIPELPKAKYKVWVRGYGLVDSAKVDSEPGKLTNLTAVKAPNEAAAAEYYPQGYWYALMKFPERASFRARATAATAFPRRCARNTSGSTASRPMAAGAVTGSATRRRARSRKTSARSRTRTRPGPGASNPARR
jgi:hypothetical protein